MATDQARIVTSAGGLLSPITMILPVVTDPCWPGLVFVASRLARLAVFIHRICG